MHVYDPTVFVHEAKRWQSCAPLTHSSMTVGNKEKGKVSKQT